MAPVFGARSPSGVFVDATRWAGTRSSARIGDTRVLGRLATAQGMTAPSVITADPFTAAYGDFAWAGAVTYFAWDDWSAHPGFRKWWPVYNDAYRTLVERGVKVAAVSEPLRARVGGDERGVVVPNAVDPHEWSVPGSPPTSLGRLPPPRIVYVGALDERLDVEAVAGTRAGSRTAPSSSSAR